MIFYFVISGMAVLALLLLVVMFDWVTGLSDFENKGDEE